jgi:hypothetical protein
MSRQKSAYWVSVVYATCLLGAGLNHCGDIWRGGWLPYRASPLFMNWYWSSLAAIDLIAAILLFLCPRVGALLTLTIIVSDVGVNSYAVYGLGYNSWLSFLSLQLQTAFLGFVLGSFSIVWRRA